MHAQSDTAPLKPTSPNAVAYRGLWFVRIREILQAYPEIVLHVEEMGDFFKVELQQVEPVTPPITPPNHPPHFRRGPCPGD